MFAGSDSLRRTRLEAEMAKFTGELNARVIRDPPPHGPGDWQTPIRDLLYHARQALQRNADEKAWRLFNSARRLRVFGMGDGERRAEGLAVLAEAKEKLKGWRKDTVVQSLGALDQAPTPAQLHHARAIVDEHLENVYLKLALFANRVRVAPFMLLGAIILLLTIAEVGMVEDTATVLGSRERLAVILALGVIGATLSATFTTVRGGGRIPQVLRGGVEASIRPFVGAVSAATVVIILQSGILAVTFSGEQLYPIAIAAGFSERLVTRLLKRVEDAADQ